MSNIILIGNPNTGKTTLFNTLTKSNNHVGNWHGVTVDSSSSKFKHKGVEHTINDLPGVYSLNAYSPEEKVSTDFLNNNKDSLVVNICDANNLKRNLLLCLELLEKGHKVVLAVNMANEVKDIDYSRLSKSLGVVAVPVDARKKKGVQPLLDVINKIDDKYNPIANLPYIGKLVGSTDADIITRFNYIDNIIRDISPAIEKIYGFSKLDKLLYNKFLVVPIFLCVLLLVFSITFGAISQNFSVLVENSFGFFADKFNDLLCKLTISSWAHTLIMQGVIGGIGVVVSFLPQVVLLFLCMNFLEDIGYLSRVAFMLDGSLKKIGLTGKSVFSLLMGYGCTTTALLTTKGLDNINLRKRTAFILPFASCSAKLPVYALICSAFFTKHKVIIVFGLYLLGAAIGLATAAISNKLTKTKEQTFIMEMPPLRIPTIGKTLVNVKSNVINFIKRVGGTLVICSVIVWLISNFSFSFAYVGATDNSIIQILAKYISFIFKPLGFGSWGAVAALLVGLVAKEMIVSCLSIANGVVGSLAALATSLTISTNAVFFTPASSISFLVFILLYSPCISALSVTAKEMGKKFAIKLFAFQFAIAYISSFIVYRLALMASIGQVWQFLLIAFSLAMAITFVIKYIKKKRKNKCVKCKGKFCGNSCV